MSLAAGELNRRIDIDAPSNAVDAIGMPVVGDAGWTAYKSTWANIKGQSGMGVIRGSADGADISINAYSFRIRYTPAITRAYRVRYGGNKYAITDVRHDLERQEWTDLICQVGANDG